MENLGGPHLRRKVEAVLSPALAAKGYRQARLSATGGRWLLDAQGREQLDVHAREWNPILGGTLDVGFGGRLLEAAPDFLSLLCEPARAVWLAKAESIYRAALGRGEQQVSLDGGVLEQREARFAEYLLPEHLPYLDTLFWP